MEDLVSKSTSSANIFHYNLQIQDPKIDEFYNNYINLDNEEIIKLCHETISQSKCKKWHNIRELRISASAKAHKIKSRKKNKCSKTS